MVALFVAAAGCLNPRPEDFPSAALAPGESATPELDMATPSRETCSDNPLLAGCEAPSAGGNDSGGSVAPVDEEERPGESSGSDADAGDGEDVDAAPVTDAGTPTP